MYGVASKKIDKQFGHKLEDVEKQGINDYILNPQTKTALTQSIRCGVVMEPKDLWHHIHTAKIPDGYRSGGVSGAVFKFYCFAISCMGRYCSIIKCFFRSLILEIQEDDMRFEELELFEHDPRFWQQPSQYIQYFVWQADGKFTLALWKYCQTLAWKSMQLVKMTIGFWDHSLIENMQIKPRAKKLNLDELGDDPKHEEMIANVGLLHALIWQLIPYCVFIGKAGEAFNATPVFVYDDTDTFTVREATRRQDALGGADDEFLPSKGNPVSTTSDNDSKGVLTANFQALGDQEGESHLEVSSIYPNHDEEFSGSAKHARTRPSPRPRIRPRPRPPLPVNSNEDSHERDLSQHDFGAPSSTVLDDSLQVGRLKFENDVYVRHSQIYSSILAKEEQHVWKINYTDSRGSFSLAQENSISDGCYWLVKVEHPLGSKI